MLLPFENVSSSRVRVEDYGFFTLRVKTYVIG